MRPRHMMAKYSAGPNLSAIPLRGKARNMSPTRLRVPAMNEPNAAMPRAGPAFPFWAIWYPSKQVTTEEASPGIFTRTEVMVPPYCAP